MSIHRFTHKDEEKNKKIFYIVLPNKRIWNYSIDQLKTYDMVYLYLNIIAHMSMKLTVDLWMRGYFCSYSDAGGC